MTCPFIISKRCVLSRTFLLVYQRGFTCITFLSWSQTYRGEAHDESRFLVGRELLVGQSSLFSSYNVHNGSIGSQSEHRTICHWLAWALVLVCGEGFVGGHQWWSRSQCSWRSDNGENLPALCGLPIGSHVVCNKFHPCFHKLTKWFYSIQ
jgi:hypothetical protein